MIIGVSGYAGTGKDTVGTIIQQLCAKQISSTPLESVVQNYLEHQWWLEEKSTWKIKKFAGKLKEIASLLTGISVEDFEQQDFKKTNLGPEWDCNPWGKTGTMHKQPLTVREFLQRLGTDAMRCGLHENTWVNALMADYKPLMSASFGIIDLGASVSQMEKMSKPIPIEYPNWIITDTRFVNEAQAIKDAGGIIIRIERPGYKPVNNHSSETELDNWQFDHKIMNGSDLNSLMFTVDILLKKEKIK